MSSYSVAKVIMLKPCHRPQERYCSSISSRQKRNIYKLFPEESNTFFLFQVKTPLSCLSFFASLIQFPRLLFLHTPSLRAFSFHQKRPCGLCVFIPAEINRKKGWAAFEKMTNLRPLKSLSLVDIFFLFWVSHVSFMLEANRC